MSLFLNGQTVVRWHTSMGNFTAELREDVVPITAYNFINLTNSNFYDGLIFHRVVSGFVIQDGDPTGTGYGGSGTTIPLEIHPEMVHNTAGTLGMARSTDPNSASSQYYITLAPTPNLNGNYAVFGYVIEGIGIVQAIGAVATNNSVPIVPVFIDSIRILTPHVTAFEPPNRDLEIEQNESVLFALYCNDFPVSYQWSLNNVPIENDFFFLQQVFSDAGTHQISVSVGGEFEYDYVMTWNILVHASSSQIEHQITAKNSIYNYPNPFNLETTICYEISGFFEQAEMQIYNVKGQYINQFPITSQKGSVQWNAKNYQNENVSSGLYFYILRVNGAIQNVNKCLLIK